MSRRLPLLVVVLLALGLAIATPAAAATPTITSVSPTSGPINTPITITGTDFVAPATVQIGGVAATYVVVVSATKITARVPKTGTGPVVVTSGGSTVTGPTFTVTPGLQLSTTLRRPGETLTVTGAGFAAGEAVDTYLDSAATGLVVSAADGTFTTTVTTPRTITPGSHWISAVGRRSGTAAQAAFVVRTDWAAPSFDAGHTGVNPFETRVTTATVDDITEKWSSYYGVPVTSAPAVAGGIVYLHSQFDEVIAVDAATGAQKWRIDLSDGSLGAAAPVFSGGVLYVGASDGFLYALTAATGAVKWKYNTGGPVAETPTVAGTTVYVPSRGGALYALNTADGSVRWGTSIGGTGTYYFSPTVVGSSLYVGGSDNTMRRISATTGGTGWVVDISGQPYTAPVVADGRVFAGTLAGTVVALNANTGTQTWRAVVGTGSVVGTPALYGGRLIATNGSSVVTAYDYTSGEVLWTQSGSTKAGYSQVSVASGVAYVSNATRTFAYDVRTGTILRRMALSPNTAGVVITDGAVYGYDYGDSRIARYDLGSANGVARPSPATLSPTA